MQELENNLGQAAKLNYLLRRLRSKVCRIPAPTEDQTREERAATISRGVYMMGNIRRFFRVHRKALARAGVTWESVFGHEQITATAAQPERVTGGDDSGRRLVRAMKHSTPGCTSYRMGIEPPRKRSFMEKLRGMFVRGPGGARGR